MFIWELIGVHLIGERDNGCCIKFNFDDSNPLSHRDPVKDSIEETRRPLRLSKTIGKDYTTHPYMITPTTVFTFTFSETVTQNKTYWESLIVLRKGVVLFSSIVNVRTRVVGQHLYFIEFFIETDHERHLLTVLLNPTLRWTKYSRGT